MAQIPYPSVTKPKPAGNPYANIQVAPKTPTVSYVRPTGPAPAAPKDNFLRGSKASSNPYMAQEFAKDNNLNFNIIKAEGFK